MSQEKKRTNHLVKLDADLAQSNVVFIEKVVFAAELKIRQFHGAGAVSSSMPRGDIAPHAYNIPKDIYKQK